MGLALSVSGDLRREEVAVEGNRAVSCFRCVHCELLGGRWQVVPVKESHMGPRGKDPIRY